MPDADIPPNPRTDPGQEIAKRGVSQVISVAVYGVRLLETPAKAQHTRSDGTRGGGYPGDLTLDRTRGPDNGPTPLRGPAASPPAARGAIASPHGPMGNRRRRRHGPGHQHQVGAPPKPAACRGSPVGPGAGGRDTGPQRRDSGWSAERKQPLQQHADHHDGTNPPRRNENDSPVLESRRQPSPCRHTAQDRTIRTETDLRRGPRFGHGTPGPGKIHQENDSPLNMCILYGRRGVLQKNFCEPFRSRFHFQKPLQSFERRQQTPPPSK